MNNQYLRASLWQATYFRSPYTQASYYAEELARNFEIANDAERRKVMKAEVRGLVSGGERHLLPYRIGILQGDSCRSIHQSGRGCRAMDAQLKGAYTQAEISPYKQYPKYEVQTALWRVEGSRTMYYGSVGITGANGRIDRDNGDLLIMRTEDFDKVEIFIFRGLAGTSKQLDHLQDAVEFVKGLE